MNGTTIAAFFLMLAGLYTLVGGALDWEWFMSRSRATRLVKMIGRTGARIFYIVVGGILFAIGLLALLGVISLG